MIKRLTPYLFVLACGALLASCGSMNLFTSSGLSPASSATTSVTTSTPATTSEGLSPASSAAETTSSGLSPSSSAISEGTSAETTSSGVTPTSSATDPATTSEGTSQGLSPSSSAADTTSQGLSPASSATTSVPTDTSAFTLIDADGSPLTPVDGVYTITQGGSYTASGTLVGMIYIDVPETDDKSGEVELILNGVTMSYGGNSVIYCVSADKLEISAKKNTVNKITDTRSVQTADDDTQGGGVIYSKVDTKLKGAGTLTVVGTYNNGVHVTKDLEIQKLTLTVQAINNAIKGNDSITVNSGTITAISVGGDGFKTEDSDVSSKGKQRGDIAFLGGTIDIYSACDGVQAAHDFYLGDADNTGDGAQVTVHTNKYSPYTDESAIDSTSSAKMYLRTTSYSSSYRYSVYFYDNDGNSVWSDATYLKSQSSGRSTYYYYELERPSSYGNFKIYAFNANQADNSTSNYVASSNGNTVNSSYDTASFTLRSGSISLGSWSNYSSSSSWGGGGFGPGGGGFPGGQEGNSDKADVSAKGVKAMNDIYSYYGTITIQAYDDGLHANYGDTLGETGATYASTGDVYIYGGTLNIDASDDGVHADRHLRISGGTVNVNSAYEGLEGNQIHISGGSSYVYGSDDAVNAGNGSGTAGLTPLVEVTGGYLFAAVPSSGDVDGIDSNGNYVQSGGTVICAGPSSGMASALDTDGTVTISSGTLVIFGASEKTPSYGGTTRSTKSGTYGSNKSYTLTYANGTNIVTGKLVSSYNGCTSYSSNGTLQTIA